MVAPKYDVFISHAEADKPGFVELLANRLQRAGVRVWYDDLAVGWGDSLSSAVARGLAESRYGIVVLSRSFLNGGWPRHELSGLWQREIHAGKIILPILHDITEQEVREFDPSLADKRALHTSRHSLEQIVEITLRFLHGDTGRPDTLPPDLLDVRGLADLARMDPGEVQKRLERYANAVRLNPSNCEIALGLALIHLALRRFPEAIEKLTAAVQFFPASGKAHLYYALALMKARRPKTLSLAEARRVLNALETASSLEPRNGLCDLLALMVKQDYFRMNGLIVPPPAVDDHRKAIEHKRIDVEELSAFRDLFVIHDQSLLDAIVH